MFIPIINHDWTNSTLLTQCAFGGNTLKERVRGISVPDWKGTSNEEMLSLKTLSNIFWHLSHMFTNSK